MFAFYRYLYLSLYLYLYFRCLHSVGTFTWSWLSPQYTGEPSKVPSSQTFVKGLIHQVLKYLKRYQFQHVSNGNCIFSTGASSFFLLHQILHFRVLLRTVQIFSCDVRYFMMKMTMYKYLTNNKHINHIKYYLRNCR